MAERTLNHFYRTYAEAVQAVADLTALGIPTTDISLVESEADARLPQDVAADSAQHPAAAGATLGAAIGAGIGLLDGIGAIAIPFTAPLLDAGWIVPGLVFAAIGALLGALIGAVTRLGVTNNQAHSLATGLKRGQHLIMVRVDAAFAPQVAAVLAQPHAPTPAAPDDETPAFDDRGPAGPRALQYRSE